MRSISGVFLVALLALTAVGQAGASVRDSLALRITQVDLTRFPYVQLKVEVRRNGLLQHTLNSPDFSIREDGIAQFVESLACPGDSLTRLSVAILLDRSGSMATDDDGGPDPDSVKLRAAKAATSTFLSFLESRDEACMYSFASSFAANQSFTNDTARLRGALVPISAYGSTAIWESMLRTLDSLRARAGRRVMICLTDGRSQKEDPRRFTYSKVIDKAVLERVPVYIIGLGSDVDENTLTSIANSTGGKYYTSPGPADLEAIFGRIADDIITDACVLRYTSTNPASTDRCVSLK
ncbi:MAG: VWA domain-containing protein [Ignavibacteria bacterium]|nr:VWA domain-containing protein [Ignavibacteria bacterium]